jgi:uncharacterized Zn finger protein (UPF0148 family)
MKHNINDMIAFFANEGVKGRTRTIKFEPVRTGKSMLTKKCDCSFPGAIVFRGFEDKSVYMLACPSCGKRVFRRKGNTKTPAAYEGQGRALKYLNKTNIPDNI